MSECSNRPGSCPSCGSPVDEAVRFCESCGAELFNPPDQTEGMKTVTACQVNEAVDREGEGKSYGRGKRVILAIAMVTLTAVVLGWWVAATMDLSAPPSVVGNLSSEELFPVKLTGIDSINNTIDGKKILIQGDGHIMNSPGLGVDRPVWVLMGPKESAFTIPVEPIKGKIIFTPEVQALIPELVQATSENEDVTIRLSLISSEGQVELVEYHLKAANRWQKLSGNFAYDLGKSPYHLRFESNGFKGAIYIDLILLLEPKG